MSHSLGSQFEPEVLSRAAEHTKYAKAITEGGPWDAEYSADHSKHGANPIFHATGWHDAGSPCGYVTCKHASDSFNDTLDAKELAPGKKVTINPREVPLVAHEPAIDLHTVQQYAKQPPKKSFVPKLVEHEGQLHISDGHHRLLGAYLAGRDIDVEVV
jgi:hypothetical protein